MGHTVLAALGGILIGGSTGFWIAILALHHHMAQIEETFDLSARLPDRHEPKTHKEAEALACH
jgi:hypothetical protein